MSGDVLLECVQDFFVNSHDFNGIRLDMLLGKAGLDTPEFYKHIEELIAARRIDLAFGSLAENPHIKRLRDLPPEVQTVGLRRDPLDTICAYPSPEAAAARPDLNGFAEQPYTRRLALAEPQLIPVFFDLSVLEKYFRDPRYLCVFNDCDGYISVRDKHYESEAMPERDKILMQTFGIGYDKNRVRVVAVFLRYLSHLSPQHQQAWKAHEVDGPCTMNSDYERASIWGQWPEYHSAYEAFIHEQIEINKLTGMIGKPPLFKKTFDQERPIEFTPMLRPTTKSFQEFCHVLDKMLSENINREFFKGDIPLEDRIRGEDGVEVRQLGTITLLERWLRRHYRTRDGEERSREVLQSWKEVRQCRQPQAHALCQDEYDTSLPRSQDELVGRSIRTLQTLRLIFMSHPKAKGYSPPEWLDSDKIVFY